MVPKIFQKSFYITKLAFGRSFDLILPISQNITRQSV